MINLTTVGNLLTRNLGRTGLVLQKFAPDIMMYAGIGGVVVSTVMACKATTKANVILDDAEIEVAKIENVREMSEAGELKKEYTQNDYRKDRTIVMGQTTVKLLRVYGPAIGVGLLSVGLIVGGHNILKKRNVALAAAFSAIDYGFKNYRRRVIEEFGEQKDFEYRHGIKRTQKITTVKTDEEGNEIEVEREVTVLDPEHDPEVNLYERYFAKGYSSQWSENIHYNQTFLEQQQRYANQLLFRRGHVFLNEIYDMLGFERTPAGAVVGWVLNSECGENHISFRLRNMEDNRYRNDHICDTKGEEREAFWQGFTNAIMLDFNVDGVMYHLI